MPASLKRDRRHCSTREVEGVRNLLRRKGVKDHVVAEQLSLSRTHVNRMLNLRDPMQLRYKRAMERMI